MYNSNYGIEISYRKSNGAQLTYQSANIAWTIEGTGIHIYGGGTHYGSGDSKSFGLYQLIPRTETSDISQLGMLPELRV
jgi:hypothetical protein